MPKPQCVDTRASSLQTKRSPQSKSTMAATSPNGEPSSEAVVNGDGSGEKPELKDALKLLLEDRPKALELGSLISALQSQYGFEGLLPNSILAVLTSHPSTFVFRVCSGEIVVGTKQSQLKAYVQTAPKIPVSPERMIYDGAFAYEKQRAPVGRYFPVTVAQIKSPQDFVLRIHDENLSTKLAALHDAMDEVYAGPQSAAYCIPQIPVPIGLPCAAPSPSSRQEGGNWRRAVVAADLLGDMVQVSLVDHHGECVVRRSELRVLIKDFFDLPAQNVPAMLAYVCPIDPTAGWCEDSRDLLITQTKDKILMCLVVDARGPIRVLLCDTSCEEDVFLNATLVEEELASLSD